MTGGENIVTAVADGVTDRAALMKRSGLTEGSLSATLSKLVLAGRLVADKKNDRNYDWSTLRLPRPGVAVNVVRGQPSKPRAEKPSVAEKRESTPVPTPTGDGLEDCTSVTYQPEEIAALVELEATLTIAVAKVREVVNALQASPKLGPKGAAAMRLIATLMAETK